MGDTWRPSRTESPNPVKFCVTISNLRGPESVLSNMDTVDVNNNLTNTPAVSPGKARGRPKAGGRVSPKMATRSLTDKDTSASRGKALNRPTNSKEAKAGKQGPKKKAAPQETAIAEKKPTQGEPKTFKCPDKKCDKVYKSKQGLKKHAPCHDPAYNWTCKFCKHTTSYGVWYHICHTPSGQYKSRHTNSCLSRAMKKKFAELL